MNIVRKTKQDADCSDLVIEASSQQHDVFTNLMIVTDGFTLTIPRSRLQKVDQVETSPQTADGLDIGLTERIMSAIRGVGYWRARGFEDGPAQLLNIQIPHVAGVLLDKLAARLDLGPHQNRKDVIRLGSVVKRHLQ